MNARTEPHPPTNEPTPANYRFHGVFDLTPSNPAPSGFKAHLLSDLHSKGKHLAEHQKDDACGHCGVTIRYAALMEHTASGELTYIGETCLKHQFREATAQFKQARGAAKRTRENAERLALFARHVTAATAYDPALAILDSYEACEKVSGYLCDIRGRMFRAPLTERQMAAAVRILNAAQSLAVRMTEERADSQPAPEGPTVITGEIRKIQIDTHPRSGADSPKMLVRDDGQFSVWGDVPAALVALHHNTFELEGKRVTYSATLKPTEADPTFAYANSPKGGALLPEGEHQAA